ncbi:MAG: hypothetical protein N3B12_02045 [Armatimonadetes bacterium]|nr:hypothetical protein [Armatimonadota bacterium]
MTDRKSIAVALGVAAGVAAVVATIAVYTSRHREATPRDVNEIFDAAKETLRKLDEALAALRKSNE